MQEETFWVLNGIINNLIIELLPFLTLKIKDKYKKYKYWIYAAVNVFDLIFFWRKQPNTFSLVVLLSMTFFIATIFFQDVVWKKILITVIYDFIFFLLEFTALAYLQIFLKGTFQDDVLMRTTKFYAATTFNNMLYLIFVLLTVVLWKYFVSKEKNKRFLLFLAISIYQLVLTGIFVSFSIDYSLSVMWLGLLMVIMNFAIDLIVFFFIKQLEKKKLMDAELAQLYNLRNQELEQYKSIETQLKTLREQRHEFANQIQTAYMMIEQHTPTEQIEQYLSDILNTIT